MTLEIFPVDMKWLCYYLWKGQFPFDLYSHPFRFEQSKAVELQIHFAGMQMVEYTTGIGKVASNNTGETVWDSTT